MYRLRRTPHFQREHKHLIKKDRRLAIRIDQILAQLSKDPFQPNLKSHPVSTRQFGVVESSRVTGDIRILWNFDSDGIVIILLLDIGGHSGKRKVYR